MFNTCEVPVCEALVNFSRCKITALFSPLEVFRNSTQYYREYS